MVKVRFNGQLSKSIGSVNPDDYFGPNTHIATEEDFIAFLEAGGKYDDKSLVGYKVQLSNINDYNNGIWIIADVGHHADQPNTYDLIPQDCFYFSRSFSNSYYWRNSGIRAWLNEFFYNTFSPKFRNHMNNITYDSNGSTYNDDKIILPSFTEINGTTGTISTYFVVEGTPYPIFTDNNSRKKYQFGTSSYECWWTRSRHTYYSNNYVWNVYTDGSMCHSDYSIDFHLVPVLRVS